MPSTIIGILNTTPDSFFDGSRCSPKEHAKRAMQMIKEGASIIDVGGESTRPSSSAVSLEEELDRVIPVINEIRKFPSVKFSIDTMKPEVAREALKLGASILNDVGGLEDEKMRTIVAAYQVPVILMHSFGPVRPMEFDPAVDMLSSVISFFKQRTKECIASGIRKENIILDPGLGFGKTTEQNIDILRNIDQIRSLGYRICIGHSRKSFIGKILGSESNPLSVEDRLAGTLGVTAYCAIKKVDYLRVHDVRENAHVVKMVEKVV